MRTHKITAYRCGTTDDVDWEAEYEVVYKVTWGSPEQGPSYSSGGQPADPDEVEFVSITPRAGDRGAQDELENWASDWLQDAGYDDAIEQAEGYDE